MASNTANPGIGEWTCPPDIALGRSARNRALGFKLGRARDRNSARHLAEQFTESRRRIGDSLRRRRANSRGCNSRADLATDADVALIQRVGANAGHRIAELSRGIV